MSYLDSLRDRRRANHTIIHQLRTTCATGKYNIYNLFEGEDDEQFYTSFIKKKFPEKNMKNFICSGKGGVLGVYDSLCVKPITNRNIYYFIDKDHDDFLEISNYDESIFVTSGYSVENYLLNDNCFMSLISEAYNITEADPLYHSIEAKYRDVMDYFIAKIILLMSSLICARRHDLHLDTESMHICKFFRVEKLEIKRIVNGFASYLTENNINFPITNSEIRLTASLLKRSEPKQYIRGKFISQLYIRLLKQVGSVYDGSLKENGMPIRVVNEINGNNIMLHASRFIEAPAEISNYLNYMQETAQ